MKRGQALHKFRPAKKSIVFPLTIVLNRPVLSGKKHTGIKKGLA
jgi:hypothetical protein